MWTKFFDGGQSNTEDERIEPGPGRVIDPGLKAAVGDTGFGQILPGKKCAQDDSAKNDSRQDGKKA